jgi:hypothetical protein
VRSVPRDSARVDFPSPIRRAAERWRSPTCAYSTIPTDPCTPTDPCRIHVHGATLQPTPMRCGAACRPGAARLSSSCGCRGRALWDDGPDCPTDRGQTVGSPRCRAGLALFGAPRRVSQPPVHCGACSSPSIMRASPAGSPQKEAIPGDACGIFTMLITRKRRSGESRASTDRGERRPIRVKTQGSLPGEDAAVVLLFSLVASRQIKLRRIDGWRTIAAVLSQHPWWQYDHHTGYVRSRRRSWSPRRAAPRSGPACGEGVQDRLPERLPRITRYWVLVLRGSRLSSRALSA